MTAFTIYALYGAPLVILAMAYIAMRIYGYGDKKNGQHHPAE
ncbi:hypothetical protein [Pelagibacterium lentulum]|uniref:Uncharacterized protein n=1 Tax=Pelagibacterium lentulum TaxID=2029865 RepID=A0A916VYC2_9HYPH|nr:hypothetical protein [Pelagibacterium lentulum]GGA51869.1 hypothetical protein GCM10011499_22390 [Pelagibacterium lentulum]